MRTRFSILGLVAVSLVLASCGPTVKPISLHDPVVPVESRRYVADTQDAVSIARADRDVPPGVVFIPFCYEEAEANMLTNPKLDPVGKIPEVKFCAARVERT